MAYKHVTPNWKAIRDAIDNGTLAELRTEQRAIEKYIQDRLRKKRDAQMAAQKEAWINSLKEVAIGDPIFFIGFSSDIEFATQGEKIRDKRTRMSVRFNGKVWDCPYTMLKPYYPSPEEISSFKVKKRITDIFNNLP